MPIIGFNLDRIMAEKRQPIKNKVSVKNDVNITDVEKFDFIIGKKKEEAVRFHFEFKTTYSPKIGELIIAGHIVYLESQAAIKKILDSWKKTKKIETPLLTTLLNMILVRCNVKALTLSQDVHLPPHLKLPRVSANVEASSYIG